MIKLRLTVITRNQKTIDKAQKLSDLIKSIVSVDSFEQIDKYPKSNDSFKITIIFDCDPTLNLTYQMIEIADRLCTPWTTYFDRTTDSVDLIYNKTDSSQIRLNEFNLIEWAELQIDEELKLATTSHIPNGGFTAFCKAFCPLKLLHGLTVESPAIRH